ncbi:hypothetical protein I350_03296 [Cryptococcus amylolentus CBS 6273]|uniref:Amidohydrolase 3 domain-containing protein n=1 Tax=Cryptococcus amylolentus CBS 6273 TaxID=1296118 RepID=A0A1E3K671_9TREE|nr:hypothetical protein I350_03296 [Cryptococcus amylolentus CBS 6273]
MPTTLIRNARLVGYPTGSTYSVFVKDGTVVSITETGSQEEEADEIIDVNDLDAQWVSPSLIDWHTHTTLNALHSHRLDLQTAKSAQDVLDRVLDAFDDPKYAAVKGCNDFTGINMRNAGWPDPEVLTRQALDKISTKRPIYLFFNGYHSICANSVGLELGGYEPEGHSGYLFEDEAFAMARVIGKVDVDAMDEWVWDESRYAASLGVTEIVDLEWDFGIPNWQRRYAKGFRSLRVHVGMYTEHLQHSIDLSLKTGDPVPNTNGLITVGPFKIVTDGSLGSQTAFCHDAYPGTPGNFGLKTYEPEELGALVKRGADNGFRMAIHAIGDHANQLTLQTLARAEAILPGSTIEHAQLLSHSDLALFKSLGLIASIQPCHLVDDRDLCHKFWPGREGRAYAFRWLVDAGIPIKMGSDCPVAPLQPWEAMAVAITRAGAGDEENPFCKEQIIDLKVAWAASTSNGKSKLEVGDRADLLIISNDPLSCDAAGLRAMKVKGTMLGGDWTHKAF